MKALRSAGYIAFGFAFLCVSAIAQKQPKDAAIVAVSPSGNDSAAGTADAPFRTLERAQAAVRYGCAGWSP